MQKTAFDNDENCFRMPKGHNRGALRKYPVSVTHIFSVIESYELPQDYSRLTGWCYLKNLDISGLYGVRTIQRAVKILEEEGFVKTVRIGKRRRIHVLPHSDTQSFFV